MKKSILILLFYTLCLTKAETLNAFFTIQLSCFEEFGDCMDGAELEYMSVVSIIDGAEEIAQKNYVKAVRNCVSQYNHCHEY